MIIVELGKKKIKERSIRKWERDGWCWRGPEADDKEWERARRWKMEEEWVFFKNAVSGSTRKVWRVSKVQYGNGKKEVYGRFYKVDLKVIGKSTQKQSWL